MRAVMGKTDYFSASPNASSYIGLQPSQSIQCRYLRKGQKMKTGRRTLSRREVIGLIPWREEPKPNSGNYHDLLLLSIL